MGQVLTIADSEQRILEAFCTRMRKWGQWQFGTLGQSCPRNHDTSNFKHSTIRRDGCFFWAYDIIDFTFEGSLGFLSLEVNRWDEDKIISTCGYIETHLALAGTSIHLLWGNCGQHSSCPSFTWIIITPWIIGNRWSFLKLLLLQHR